MFADSQSRYTTGEVAKAIGVGKKTLFRWLAAGEIPEPEKTTIGRIEYRLWSKDDLKHALAYREANYRQKRARK